MEARKYDLDCTVEMMIEFFQPLNPDMPIHSAVIARKKEKSGELSQQEEYRNQDTESIRIL